MKPKSSADQESVVQALEQLQHSVDIIQQIVQRLQRSLTQMQDNIVNEAQPQKPRQNRRHLTLEELKQKESHYQHQGHRRKDDQPDSDKMQDNVPKVLH